MKGVIKMTEETKKVEPEKKEGNEAFQPSELAQLQMTIFELQQANFKLQTQIAELRNQVLVRSELIGRVAPDWAFDPQSKMFTKIPQKPPVEEKKEAEKEIKKGSRKKIKK